MTSYVFMVAPSSMVVDVPSDLGYTDGIDSQVHATSSLKSMICQSRQGAL